MDALKELFRYIDYIKYSSKINLFSRYSNMYLGIFWWFLNPLLLMVVYYFVYIIIFQSRTENYILFILIGLIMWQWVNNTITQSTVAISSKIPIMEQVTAPKQIFPMVILVVETFMFFIGFILIAIALAIDQVPITIHVIECIPITIVTFIALYGISLIMAHFGAIIADLRPAMNYVMRMVFYLSPIFYEVSRLPTNIQKLYYFNPITIVVEGYRNVLMRDQSPDYFGLMIIAIAGVILIFVGLHLIKKHDADYCKLK